MATPTFKRPAFGFYRPHERVAEDGLITNPATGEITRPPSMTKQAHKDECDINRILKQYKTTGVIQHISAKAQQGVYEDLPDPIEFQDALHVVMQAESSFETLSSSVRNRFNNDPMQFLEFTSNPANLEEMEKLGLIPARTEGPNTGPIPDPEAAPAPSTPPATQAA